MFTYFLIYSILVSCGSDAGILWKDTDNPLFLCLNICPWHCWDRRPKDDASSLRYLKTIYSTGSNDKSNRLIQTNFDDKTRNERWLFKTTTEKPTTKKEDPQPHVHVVVVNVPTIINPLMTTTPKPTTKVEAQVYVMLVTAPTTTMKSTMSSTEKPDTEKNEDHWVCSICKKQCHY